MSNKTVFGIDLGTTYSCISYIDEFGQAVVVANNEGDLTTPSVVFFETEENFVVGKNAKDAIKTDSRRVVSKIKREMGNPDYRFEIDHKEYRPEEISALILKKVVADAALSTGKEIDEVVITCPAYFGLSAREATKKAGEIAGLTVRYVIPEPTAAAIVFGESLDEDDTILVYDLGGGTFDVTLIDVTKGALTVLSTGGDAELGGDNWDSVLKNLLAQKVADELGLNVNDVCGDEEFYPELGLIAEDTKKKLSNQKSAKLALRYGAERVMAEVTREDFDNLTRHLLDRTIEITRSVVDRAAANTSMARPRKILLVGGSTYMPQVKERVELEFPSLEIKQQDPNLIVAKGAAVFGLKMLLEDTAIKIINEQSPNRPPVDSMSDVDKKAKELALAEAGAQFGLSASYAEKLVQKRVSGVTPRSCGLKIYVDKLKDFRIINVIHVDEPTPVSKPSQTFSTMEDRQSTVQIEIFENEIRTRDVTAPGDPDPLVEEASCIPLASTVLDLGGPYPKGSPIEVSFQLSADGLLDVVAKHPATGKSVEVQTKIVGVMSDEEVVQSRSALNGLIMT